MNDQPLKDESFQPLIDRVTEGLDAGSELELLEHTTAAAHTALIHTHGLTPLPVDLRRKLMAVIPSHAAVEAPILRPSFRANWIAWSGWITAAAAMVVSITLWAGRNRNSDKTNSPVRLAESLEMAPDLIRLRFPASGQATGEILWSTARQSGELRLKGLRPNDPLTEQFQLWIVDPLRDPAAPVDGGVFDIGSAGESVIPIHAKLNILMPKAFIITREQPGGVVKSQSKQPVLVASVSR